MIRWACVPILAVLLAGCAPTPAETAATDVPGSHAHPAPRIRTLFDDIRDAQAKQAAVRPPAASPPISAATPRPAGASRPPGQPVQAAARKPAAPVRPPVLPPKPATSAKPETPAPAATDLAVPAPFGACPELALSYCLGRLTPLTLAMVARLPLDKVLSLHRCGLDIYINAPVLFGIRPDSAPNPLAAIRDHCSVDYAAVRALIGARVRLGQ